MDQLEAKQVQSLLKAMTKGMVSGSDQDVTDEDLVSALLEGAEDDTVREVAVGVRRAIEEIIGGDMDDEGLAEYLNGTTWAKEKEVARVVQKWWRNSKDLIIFTRLAQNSIKPTLEAFKWKIITATTSTGNSEHVCRISLNIRQPNGVLTEMSFDTDVATLGHVVETITQIEETVAGTMEQ